MKWILCDERLPEEGQMVLTTIRGHDVIILQEGETLEEAMERIWNDVCYVSIGFIGSDGWYGADGFPEVVHPIAWMPLPKPYKADRKTENSSEKPNNCDTCSYSKVGNDDYPCVVCTGSDMYEPKDEPQISPSDCKTCKNNLWSTPRTCGKCSRQKDGKPSMYEPQTETSTNSEKVQLKGQLTDEPQTDCETCKHYVYQLGCTHHANCEYEPQSGGNK